MTRFNFDTVRFLGPQDIDWLIDQRVPESETIDFKLTAKSLNYEEWSKDVSAMANTEGGCVVFGIDEEDAVATSAPGIPSSDYAALEQRLISWAREHVVPSLTIRVQRIDLEEGKCVAVAAVQRSQAAPHMCKPKSMYYRRHGSHTEPLRPDQLRSMFVRSITLEQELAAAVSGFLDRRPPIPGRYLRVGVAMGAEHDDPAAFDPALYFGTNALSRIPAAHDDRPRFEDAFDFDGWVGRGLADHRAAKLTRGGMAIESSVIEAEDRNSYGKDSVHVRWLPQAVVHCLYHGLQLRDHVGLPGAVTATVCVRALADTPVRPHDLSYRAGDPEYWHKMPRGNWIFPPVPIDPADKPLPNQLLPVWFRLWNLLGEQAPPFYQLTAQKIDEQEMVEYM